MKLRIALIFISLIMIYEVNAIFFLGPKWFRLVKYEVRRVFGWDKGKSKVCPVDLKKMIQTDPGSEKNKLKTGMKVFPNNFLKRVEGLKRGQSLLEPLERPITRDNQTKEDVTSLDQLKGLPEVNDINKMTAI